MNIKHLRTGFLIILLFSFSCTPYKNVPYFQDLKTDSVIKEKITNYSQLTIQPGDILNLHVSSLNHEADGLFNYNLERQTTQTAGNLPGVEQTTVFGYKVDQEGNIHLPMVGEFKVAGLSTDEIAAKLETRLSEFLSKLNVQVRLQNFKISVLGDVKSPGSFLLENETITVSEALSLAGDLNTTGIRTNVLLIREINGERKYIRLDLTSKSLFNSPYYYLRNRDVIYVQPNKERVNNDSTAFAKASLVLTVLSILAIILSKHL
jgi:polysaccharide export outer membrane protein